MKLDIIMDLFKLFESINIKKIEAYVQNKQEENLHLDFKTINDPAFKHRYDKRNFAKVLGGFSNSNRN